MFNLTQFDNGFVSHTVTGISRETTHMEQVCYLHLSRSHTGKGWNTSALLLLMDPSCRSLHPWILLQVPIAMALPWLAATGSAAGSLLAPETNVPHQRPHLCIKNKRFLNQIDMS
jgi:hypothetical protein